METITLEKDIRVFYVIADTFPEGIMEAHEKLHELVPFSKERRFFGISRPEDGGEIVYRAAAEELYQGEAQKFNCETLVLKLGRYISLTVYDYLENVQNIDEAFKKLLSYPAIDPNGYCVEWYLNDKDIRCMVRLDNI